MKLTSLNFNDYLKQTYSRWLGKLIGVRLGAPIENWSYSQIKEKYPEIKDYVCDYGIFAADDDSNGPLFFVRALLDKNDISPEDVGDAFINYIQEYSGFFWWGGPGVSSEHTAYENVKNGIMPPLSGAKETNGIVIAEQIGGQIFSDCWGYVAGYDPDLAVALARKAASVTHDGNGLEGAAFVAAAITYAYTIKDIYEVMEKALSHLDKDMEYYKVARDIIRFYRENPEDWEKCLNYIFDNYGYDRYPGVCHIIPNTALMIMSMCYGEGDFDKTLCMLVQCGWDTDCTAGNVGSIMGALVGVDNIDEKWILPINDIVNASSCIGYLNIQTASHSAYMFASLAMKLQGLKAPEEKLFTLPYATSGFFCDGSVKAENGKLMAKGSTIYKYSYYLPQDVFDARYDPVYSPTVYPGDIISFTVDKPAVVFAEDCNGNRFFSEKGVGTIELQVPVKVNEVIRCYGLLFDGEITVSDYSMENHSAVETDFTDYSIDGYGPRYAGDTLYNIRGYVPHSGDWNLGEKGLFGKAGEHALITTGSLEMQRKKLEMEFEITDGDTCCIAFDCQGFNRFKALGIYHGKLALIEKNKAIKVLRQHEIALRKSTNYRLQVNICNGKIKCNLNNSEFVFDLSVERLPGITGVYAENSQFIIKVLNCWSI